MHSFNIGQSANIVIGNCRILVKHSETDIKCSLKLDLDGLNSHIHFSFNVQDGVFHLELCDRGATLNKENENQNINEIITWWIPSIYNVVQGFLAPGKLNVLTKDQYYEVMYELYRNVFYFMGLDKTTRHLIMNEDFENRDFATDLKMVLNACILRNVEPDWIRAGLGYGNDPVPQSISKNGKRG